MILFLIGELLAYHRRNAPISTFIDTMVAVGVFLLYLRVIVGVASMMNRVVKKISIEADAVHFETFDSSVIFHLIRKDAQIVDTFRGNFEFTLAKLDYKFDKDYTGDIYVLDYAGTHYLLPENFYTDFYELKAELSRSAQAAQHVI
jgi:hypothetical protein